MPYALLTSAMVMAGDSSLGGLGRFVDAPQGVQAAGIADVGQALGDDLDQEGLVVADLQIGAGVADELRLTAALGGQEAEGDHLPLLIVQPLPGVVVPEAVVRQPLVA